FQADRDLIIGSGFRVVPLDPSLDGARTGAKLGFDCTMPFGKTDSLEFSVPTPPSGKKAAMHKSVAEVLAAGPASFLELMGALGSKDGREIVRELDALYATKRLGRQDDGRYVLKKNG
ncbi:MAG: UbiD family decarboxylase, partial [Xanthobacteraceae bacterium]